MEQANDHVHSDESCEPGFLEFLKMLFIREGQ